jgi:dTDP-4-amino-4,6-dideoxygalactose transaminase
MSNICAGIGRVKWKFWIVISLRKNARFYVDIFKDIEGVTVFSVPNDTFFSNYWLSAILIDPAKTVRNY